MQASKITILCTRHLDQHLILKAEDQNVQIEALTFIEIKKLDTPTFISQVRQLSLQKLNVVFTSISAVESIAPYVEKYGEWKIFCIGGVTKEACIRYFDEKSIELTAKNASLLARKIIDGGNIKEVIFFCGDHRLDDLPETLRANSISVQELIAYNTLQTPHDVEKNYDGIMFFSPTAVHSFFSANTIRTDVVLFSIGRTTTATIKTYCMNKVITSEWPGQENLLDKLLEYYHVNHQP